MKDRLFGYKVTEDPSGLLTIRRAKNANEEESTTFDGLKASLITALQERRADLLFEIEQNELNIQGVATLQESETFFLKVPEVRCLH